LCETLFVLRWCYRHRVSWFWYVSPSSNGFRQLHTRTSMGTIGSMRQLLLSLSSTEPILRLSGATDANRMCLASNAGHQFPNITVHQLQQFYLFSLHNSTIEKPVCRAQNEPFQKRVRGMLVAQCRRTGRYISTHYRRQIPQVLPEHGYQVLPYANPSKPAMSDKMRAAKQNE
jgi:hypothetical protein